MPVEIKELIIRATIVNPKDPSSTVSNPRNSEAEEQIIAACVARVLEILDRRQER